MAMAAASTKFIPEVYAAGVEHDLNEQWIMVALCNKKYEGEIKKQGDTVKIRTAGRITAHSLTRDTKRIDLTAEENAQYAAEEIQGDIIEFPVDQIRFTHVFVDSIDEIATDVSLMNMSTKETAVALAAEHDKYVAQVAYTQAGTKMDAVTALSPSNVLDVILNAKTTLYKHNVSRNASLELVVSPEIEAVLVKAGVITRTTNDSEYTNGTIGKVLGVNVRVSNNIYVNDGKQGCFLTTSKDAIAFAEQISKTIAYREDGKWLDRDIIKTYTLFDAKVIWEDRIVGIPVTATGITLATA